MCQTAGRKPEWFDGLEADEKLDLLRNFDVSDEELLCDAFMTCRNADVRREAAAMITDPDRLWHFAVRDPDAAAGRLRDDDQLLRIIEEIEDHTEKWKSSVDEALQFVDEQEIKITASDNIEDLELLVRPVLRDPGEHIGIRRNFKEHGIALLAREPEQVPGDCGKGVEECC